MSALVPVQVPVPVQVQCERCYIKPYNPFIHVLVAVPVLVPETGSVIKPIVLDNFEIQNLKYCNLSNQMKTCYEIASGRVLCTETVVFLAKKSI